MNALHSNEINLEELSRNNLMLFYEEELKRVDNGEDIYQIFSHYTITKLTRHGILKTHKGLHSFEFTQATRDFLKRERA